LNQKLKKSGEGHSPLPDPHIPLGRGHSLPTPNPLNASGASNLAPSALGLFRHPQNILVMALCVVISNMD